MFTCHLHLSCDTFQVSCLRCHVSCFMCQVSCVRCHVFFCFVAKRLSYLVEGLLSTGPTPSSFYFTGCHDCKANVSHIELTVTVHANLAIMTKIERLGHALTKVCNSLQDIVNGLQSGHAFQFVYPLLRLFYIKYLIQICFIKAQIQCVMIVPNCVKEPQKKNLIVLQ